MIKKIAALALLFPMFAVAAPVGLDGVIGLEWAGVTPKHVTQDPNAPENNFASPSNVSRTGYDIYLRADGNYLYTGLQSDLPNSGTNLFANLYYAYVYGNPANPSFSYIGFEVLNDRAFRPGGPANTYFNDTSANLIRVATTVGGPTSSSVIETAIDLSAFTANALGVTGYVAGQPPLGIALFLSQSFGYSVAGGDSYGPTQLGFVLITPNAAAVPEPETLALLVAAFGAAALVRRRRPRVC